MDQTGEAVDKITFAIEECGGLDLIEGLQTSNSETVQKTATEIIENFYECEPIEDEASVAPTATDNSYQFSAAGSSQTNFAL